MKYVSIDIETTGTDPEKCQVLEVGAVVEDTQLLLPVADLPRFECIVAHPEYTGSAFALNLNSRLIKTLSELEAIEDKGKREAFRLNNNILGPGQVAGEFKKFIDANYTTAADRNPSGSVTITVAGKNFSRFDWEFLVRLPNWTNHINFSRRVIDPGILFTDWSGDHRLPGLGDCMKRAGLDKEVSHRAVEDAMDVVELLRVATKGYTK